MSPAQPAVAAIDGSPTGGGRTAAALRAVLQAAGCSAPVVSIADAPAQETIAVLEAADARAGFSAAHVVPPSLYIPRDGFGDNGELLDPYASQPCCRARRWPSSRGRWPAQRRSGR